MDIHTALRDIGTAGRKLPVEALQWSLDHWAEAKPRFLAMLDGYVAGEDTSQLVADTLFYAVHLFAEQRETAAFPPFCRLLQDREAAEFIFADLCFVTSLPSLLVSLYDGDRRPLQQLIEGPQIDESVRFAALQAWGYLTFVGKIPLDDTKRYLLALYDTMRPQAWNFAWLGFAELIARLGLRRHRILVKKLFDRGLLNPDLLDRREFDELLASAGPEGGHEQMFTEAGVAPFDDTIAYFTLLNEIHAELSAARASEEADPVFDGPPWQPPLTNPLRHVGRNDLCPCGSGRKFKKCCLAAADVVPMPA